MNNSIRNKHLFTEKLTFCSIVYDIKAKALSVYKIGCNKKHRLNYICCDFKKLEEHYMEYKTNKDTN